MLLAKINYDGAEETRLFWDYEHLQTHLFDPDNFLMYCMDFRIKGKTYMECKHNAIDKGVQYSLLMSDFKGGYSNLIILQDRMYIIAKRYGLLKEFKKNGVI